MGSSCWPCLLALLVALLGCGSTAPDPKASNSGAAADGDKVTTAAKTAPNLGTQTPEAPDGLPLDKLPAELRNDAFEYYGLGNPDAVRFTVENPNEPQSQEGSQTLRLTAVNGGEASFSVIFTGALQIRGDQEMVLKSDGLYVTKMAGKTMGKPVMELPSPLTPGKRWTSDITLDDQNGQPVDIKASFKVVGPEKIKVGGSEYDTIRVDGTMTAKTSQQTIKSTVRGWYAKGTGQVKFTVNGLNGDPKKTMTVEIAK